MLVGNSQSDILTYSGADIILLEHFYLLGVILIKQTPDFFMDFGFPRDDAT